MPTKHVSVLCGNRISLIASMSETTQPLVDTAQSYFWNAAACAALADRAALASGRGAPDSATRLDAAGDYVRTLLMAQGLEFSAKAWFLHRGEPVADLKRRAFAHDLVSLFQRAAREGFPPIGHAEMWVLSMLNATLRDDKELQYAKPQRLEWPSALAVRELLHESLRALCAVLYPGVDLSKVAAARDPGRWWGLRSDAFPSYAGVSLAKMRQPPPEPVESVSNA